MNYTIESLLAEEASLRLESFTNDDAWRLGSWLVERARAESLAIAIGIVRGGQRLFWYGAEGSFADNDGWLERKLRTAQRFGHSSLFMGLKAAQKGAGLEEYGLSLSEFCIHGGAIPLSLAGTGVVGAAAVSGLAQEDDHRLVVEALRAIKR